MNAYDNANSVSARGLAVLVPYLEEVSDGRLVMSDRGKLAKWLQESAGDAVVQHRDGRMLWVEIKTEERHTGRLFLEEWSNRNLNHRGNHADLGSNPGWLCKLRSDIMLYYFLDADILYSIDLYSLQRWAYGYRTPDGKDVRGNLHRWCEARSDYEFRQVTQAKRAQANDTVGVLVEVDVLCAELRPGAIKKTQVRQRALLDEREVA